MWLLCFSTALALCPAAAGSVLSGQEGQVLAEVFLEPGHQGEEADVEVPGVRRGVFAGELSGLANVHSAPTENSNLEDHRAHVQDV